MFHRIRKEYSGSTKKCDVTEVAAQLSLRFQVKNGSHGKGENIEYLNLTPCVLKNNGLLNKTYWDNLDIIDHSRTIGNVSQFCLYLGYP